MIPDERIPSRAMTAREAGLRTSVNDDRHIWLVLDRPGERLLARLCRVTATRAGGAHHLAELGHWTTSPGDSATTRKVVDGRRYLTAGAPVGATGTPS